MRHVMPATRVFPNVRNPELKQRDELVTKSENSNHQLRR
jgi:hypothetical protein